MVHGQPTKIRQKLMRNLRVSSMLCALEIMPTGHIKAFCVRSKSSTTVRKLCVRVQIIDLLVAVLKCPLSESADDINLITVFKSAYEVLYTYMVGNSRKNALYFAKYIGFFQTQFGVKVMISTVVNYEQ